MAIGGWVSASPGHVLMLVSIVTKKSRTISVHRWWSKKWFCPKLATENIDAPGSPACRETSVDCHWGHKKKLLKEDYLQGIYSLKFAFWIIVQFGLCEELLLQICGLSWCSQTTRLGTLRTSWRRCIVVCNNEGLSGRCCLSQRKVLLFLRTCRCLGKWTAFPVWSLCISVPALATGECRLK